MNEEFVTKDSGKRQQFAGGFVRDVDDGKLRFDLIPTSMLKRLAGLYTRGIQKYGENNWQQARGSQAINRFKSSAFRHFIQWMEGEYDEDHAMAVAWNIFAYERHRERLVKEYGTCELGLSEEDLEILVTSEEKDGIEENKGDFSGTAGKGQYPRGRVHDRLR